MRGKKVAKRQITPDKIYGSTLAAKFINTMMKDGKKKTAERVFYNALEIIKKNSDDPLSVFEKAIGQVSPSKEVKARRIGGASYQIPIDVRPQRQTALAIRWIIQGARSRSNKEYHTFSEKLAAEILDILKNQGEAVKKRDNLQRMAEANKAFSHFRF